MRKTIDPIDCDGADGMSERPPDGQSDKRTVGRTNERTNKSFDRPQTRRAIQHAISSLLRLVSLRTFSVHRIRFFLRLRCEVFAIIDRSESISTIVRSVLDARDLRFSVIPSGTLHVVRPTRCFYSRNCSGDLERSVSVPGKRWLELFRSDQS